MRQRGSKGVSETELLRFNGRLSKDMAGSSFPTEPDAKSKVRDSGELVRILNDMFVVTLDLFLNLESSIVLKLLR